jgi:NADH dehydrogenase
VNPIPSSSTGRPARILLVGGGYVGMYTALRLQKRLQAHEAEITVVDPRSYMTYQPFLPEAAAGNIEARHVLVPLRQVLPRCRIVTGEVVAIDPVAKVAHARIGTGEEQELPYDHLVLAPGSVSRTLPIPGLAEVGIGFKRIEEAVYLRDHVLDQIDLAGATTDDKARRRALTFVFVGGGYAGIEALGEMENMAAQALRYYPAIRPEEMRFVLVEATGRVLPEVSEDMGRYTLGELRARGIDIRLETRLESCVDGHVSLSDGAWFETNTVVWTAGVKPHPLLAVSGLPLDAKGRLKATPELTVEGAPGHWTAGDCAAVPDLTQRGEFTGPSAQHAVRQAKQLADNLVAALRGERLRPYKHAYAGSVASLGLYQGVAQIYGIKLRGFPAWFMHRTYHLSRVPTFNRKVRVVTDWTTALFFRRELVSLGRVQLPREEFQTFASRTSATSPSTPAPPAPATSGPVAAGGDGRAEVSGQ